MKYLLIADDAAMARWKATAKDRGVSFADFLRDAAERAATGAAPPPTASGPRGDCPRARHHRSGTFCKSCGFTPA